MDVSLMFHIHSFNKEERLLVASGIAVKNAHVACCCAVKVPASRFGLLP